MTAFGKWAQSKGLNIQQLQGNEQALEQAMGQFLQEMQSAQKARLGAKLNYLRSIKGDCPEGQEVKYFKEGGRVCKKCVEKGAAGAKAKSTGKDAVKAFKDKCGTKMKKKACGGSKMKFELGGETPQKPKKVESKKPEQRLDPRTTKKLPGGKYPTYWTSKERQTWERLHGDNDEGAGAVENKGVGKNKCGGSVKKHEFGGVMFPIFQAGGSFKDAWNAARKNKQRYFNWQGRMYNSKAAGNDTEYASFADNMNEMSAQLSTDRQPRHLGWDRNNPTSSELRGRDRMIGQQGTESMLPGITVIGTRRTKKPTATARAGVNKNKATRNMSGTWGQGSGGGQQYANQRQYAFERSDFDKMRMKSAGIFGSTAYKTDSRGKRYVERDGNLYYDDGTYYSPQTRKTGKYTFTPGGLFSKNTFNLF
jgi:hypothetical protein